MTALSSRTLLTVAAIGAALVLGAGLGAAAFSVLDENATTTVREVTVTGTKPTDAASELSIGQIYDNAVKSVVEIQASGKGPGFGQSAAAQGSGFVYGAEGHIVTNQHVVAGATSIEVTFWDGTEVGAKLVGTDPSTDLAVLDVDAPRSLLHPLAFGDSSAVGVGETVFALGSPFGLEGTLTSGIVSALHREMTAPNNYTITDTIQTDAALNHGNSGGPLLDTNGRAIGVNAQIESDSGGSDGVGFAIPSNTVRSIVDQLIDTGTVQHAYLGITMVAVPDGVAVTQVRSGTPADEAGLRAATGSELVDGKALPTGGDVIVAFNGVEVTSPAALQKAVDAKRPEDRVTITILRDGRRRTLEATLGVRP